LALAGLSTTTKDLPSADRARETVDRVAVELFADPAFLTVVDAFFTVVVFFTVVDFAAAAFFVAGDLGAAVFATFVVDFAADAAFAVLGAALARVFGTSPTETTSSEDSPDFLRTAIRSLTLTSVFGNSKSKHPNPQFHFRFKRE
jgi:hypothetical protein